MWRYCLILPLLVILAGCALLRRDLTPQIVDKDEYATLVRLAPGLMTSRGLTGENVGLASPGGNWGRVLFARLSPDFLYGETGHEVYMGATFRASKTPSSHEYFDVDGNGFFIMHPSQRLAMRFLARLDWDGDGRWDWLIRCTVRTFRGDRTRHYYVLAPEPEGNAMAHGIIAVVVDDRGPVTPLVRVLDLSDYGREEDSGPKTEINFHLAGDRRVTEPPDRQEVLPDPLHERDI